MGGVVGSEKIVEGMVKGVVVGEVGYVFVGGVEGCEVVFVIECEDEVVCVVDDVVMVGFEEGFFFDLFVELGGLLFDLVV